MTSVLPFVQNIGVHQVTTNLLFNKNKPLMKKLISTAFILLLFTVVTFGQQNRISLSVGSPNNKTKYWLVGRWENQLYADLSFDRKIKKYFLVGGGLSYSTADISWFRGYHNSNQNTVSTLTPYLKLGASLDHKIASLIPHVELGYSALITDSEIYNGDNHGFYSAIGVDLNFNVTNRIQLGLGANYNVTFLKMSFYYDGIVTHDFVPVNDDRMRAESLNINLAYKF